MTDDSMSGEKPDAAEVAGYPRHALEEEKLRREIGKLDLETLKLRQDLDDAGRPYIFRNSQLLTTAIATLGAVIGFYVAFQKDYFGMLQREASFEKEQAAQSMNLADQSGKEAKTKQEEADRAQALADAKLQTAEDKNKKAEAMREAAQKTMADIRNQVASAREQAVQATRKKDRAVVQLASLLLFKDSHLPAYLYEDQHQLAELDIGTFVPETFGWINSNSLKRLSCRPAVHDGQMSIAALDSLPSSIQELSIRYPATTIDLRQLQNPQSLTDLRLLGGDYQHPQVTLEGLSAATNLEHLTVDLDSKMIGIGDIVSLNRLQTLSLSVKKMSDVPEAVFKRITALIMPSVRPIDFTPLQHEDFEKISRSSAITTVVISGQVRPPDLSVLQHDPHLATVIMPNTDLHLTGKEVFPNILRLHVTLHGIEEALRLVDEYPNLIDASFWLEGVWTAPDMQRLLDSIGERYPRLHSLTLEGLYFGPASTLTLRKMPELETLRLPLSVLYPVRDPLKITLGDSELPKLRKLSVSAYCLEPGSLRKLGHLEHLILNEAEESDIQEVTGLRALRGLGLAMAKDSRDYESRFQPRPNSASTTNTSLKDKFRGLLDSLALNELVLTGGTANLITHVPKTVHSLILVETYGGGSVPINVFSDRYFAETY
jgi:hypothetical protein